MEIIENLQVGNGIEINSIPVSYSDRICRCYTKGSKKRFMEWFNNQDEELEGIPEVALCDEIFLNEEPDFKSKINEINSLKIGESCIVENDVCIITRVK